MLVLLALSVTAIILLVGMAKGGLVWVYWGTRKGPVVLLVTVEVVLGKVDIIMVAVG